MTSKEIVTRIVNILEDLRDVDSDDIVGIIQDYLLDDGAPWNNVGVGERWDE